MHLGNTLPRRKGGGGGPDTNSDEKTARRKANLGVGTESSKKVPTGWRNGWVCAVENSRNRRGGKKKGLNQGRPKETPVAR